MTPNETMSMSVAGLDDSDLFFRPAAQPNGHHTSMTFSTPPPLPAGPIKSASHVSQQSVFLYSDEQIEAGISPPTTIGRMKRMKSLGNLPLFQRDFGGTPQDIVRMRRDFEAHRFGMARMRSMTDLMEIPDSTSPVAAAAAHPPMAMMRGQSHGEDDQRWPKSIARDSIFKRNTASLSSKQRIGVGDTKFIGSDMDRSMLSQPGRRLSKNKSMGMIPDLILERGGDHRLFLTPTKAGGEELGSDEDEGLGDNLQDVSSYERFNVILRNHRGYQVSEPGAGHRSPDELLLGQPFERGYRRSYMKMSSQSPQSPQMIMRQSDGWYTQQYSPTVPNGGQWPWAKMYRYQRQESVEERLVPVIACDRNNNINTQRHPSDSTTQHGDVVDGPSREDVVGSVVVVARGRDLKGHFNARSCRSSTSCSRVVRLNHPKQTPLPPPARCVSAEPVSAVLRRSSVERYAMGRKKESGRVESRSMNGSTGGHNHRAFCSPFLLLPPSTYSGSLARSS